MSSFIRAIKRAGLIANGGLTPAQERGASALRAQRRKEAFAHFVKIADQAKAEVSKGRQLAVNGHVSEMARQFYPVE